MASAWRNVFPPKPEFTEANVPDQSGKVFIVTGSSGGMGKELVKLVYQRNAKVYIAARSETKARAAIKEIQDAYPSSKGQLEYLYLDLSDLATIKASAQSFLKREHRLDILWNNAGVMIPPQGSKTAQGWELQLGVNSIGTFLFTEMLHGILVTTAQIAPNNSVRVIWVASGSAATAPKPAIDFDNMDYKGDESPYTKYSRSKAGNVIHAAEFARRAAGEGIITMSLDPGISKTELGRSAAKWQIALFSLIASDPKNGAYTELFAGLSPNIDERHSGGWVAPYGRLVPGRKDLLDEELGRKYWKWTEDQVRQYM